MGLRKGGGDWTCGEGDVGWIEVSSSVEDIVMLR